MKQEYIISGVHTKVPALPHQLTEHVTPVEEAIVLCHFGVPAISRDWVLVIDGMVRRPISLTLQQLMKFPRHVIESVHQCAGSPLNPNVPTQRVCNVLWGGVLLKDVLAEVQMLPTAKFLWSSGTDGGVLADIACAAYTKDLPIERINEDVLIALEMNGATLTPEHGYPARLVVPGWYGTNSVKWLRRIEVAATRASGAFTTKWYNDPIYREDGSSAGETVPVWAIAPQSIIVAPAPMTKLETGAPVEVWGWAWADSGVDQVLVGVDGSTWTKAVLERQVQRGWQRFSTRWTPRQPGKTALTSRAVDRDGTTQPSAGRRNAIFSVAVEVVEPSIAIR